MSSVEALQELKKIRGKFRKDEGIFSFSKPKLYLLKEYTLSTAPVETDVVDLSDMGGCKLIFLVNQHDAPVYVDVYTGYSPEGLFTPIRRNITVDAKSVKYGVLWEKHLFLKLSMRAAHPPSEGSFTPLIVGWSL